MRGILIAACFCLVAMALGSCRELGEYEGDFWDTDTRPDAGEPDGDTDTDTDTDVDADSDMDADSDGDSDADTDFDTHPDPNGELLAWFELNDYNGCSPSDPELIPSISYDFETPDCADLPLELADTLVDGDTGVFDFTSASNDNFDTFVGCLTNGVDDILYVLIDWPGHGGGGNGSNESDRGLGSPDLHGHEVTTIRLEVHDVIIEPASNEGHDGWVIGKWEFWGT